MMFMHFDLFHRKSAGNEHAPSSCPTQREVAWDEENELRSTAQAEAPRAGDVAARWVAMFRGVLSGWFKVALYCEN